MRSKYCRQIVMVAFFLGAVAACVAASNQKTSNAGPKYDTANQVKIKGVIQDVKDTPGVLAGTHITVKTETGTVVVYVGPADFLADIDTSFKAGDQVEVVGAKNTGPEGEEVLAKEITVGSNTTTLRDDNGVPVWSGWKSSKK
jgi:hypothetical protein